MLWNEQWDKAKGDIRERRRRLRRQQRRKQREVPLPKYDDITSKLALLNGIDKSALYRCKVRPIYDRQTTEEAIRNGVSVTHLFRIETY